MRSELKDGKHYKMYIGTTIQGSPDPFIVLEKDDSAEDLLSLMKEEDIYNLMTSGKESRLDIFINTPFSELCGKIEIWHLRVMEI